MLATSLPPLVAGVLPLDPETDAQWVPAGAWRMPVGAPSLLGAPGADDEPVFQVSRGVERSRHRVTHQGVDLSNGRAGADVRAAAAGLVVLAFDGDNGNGYGGHVVIAHRLEGGRTVYTVYAHLERGSVQVRAGEIVCAGDRLGRVGRTGRASTPHLHFEVREPGDTEERWENAAVLDPLAFVLDRAGAPVAGPADPAAEEDVSRTYLRWAVDEGLFERGTTPADRLSRAAWWRVLSRAAEGSARPGVSGEALRDSLVSDGVLPEEEFGAPGDERLGWNEFARDVRRLREVGVRVPHGPLPAADHEAACEARYGQRAPASHPSALRRRDGDPTAADASFLVADLSGPLPGPQLGPSRRPGRTTPAQSKRRAKPVRRRAR